MKSRVSKLLMCVCIVYCLIGFYSEIKISVQSAINIWVNAVIPSVFPYIVLSKYLCSSDILDIFEIFPGKFIAKIFKLSACSTKAVLCSLFCGYPSGAVCADELFKNGQIDKNEAKRIICFTNNASPLFLITALGKGLLNDTNKGFAIYAIQIASALLYGFFSSFGYNQKKAYTKSQTYSAPDFCSIIKEGVNATVNICGFMIISFVLARCILLFAANLLPFNINMDYLTTFVNGVFEISAGASSAANNVYLPFTFSIICSIVSWSGISVIMQIKSIASNILTVKDIVFAKFIQSIISFVLGLLFELFYTKNCTPDIAGNVAIRFSLIISIVVFLYYILSAKKCDKSHLSPSVKIQD